MPDTIRAFIAIELDAAIHTQLAVIQAKLKPSDADIKWVAPKNIHLTLKFLGDVEKDKIEKIKTALDTIAGQTKTFSMSLSEIGAFPNLNSPRVVWVGIAGPMQALPLLASEIEEQLSKLGFDKEDRPFSAHLTLGRMRSSKGREKLKEIITQFRHCEPGAEGEGIAMTVSKITLFQSTLTPKGSIYTSLHRTELSET